MLELKTKLLGSRNLMIGFVTIVCAIYLSADSEPLADSVDRGVKRVRVAAVEAASDSRELRFSGVTRAANRARLSFSIGGRVIARPVEVGDRVTQGQVLARLDDRELVNAVATARGALSEVAARRAQVERDVDRTRRLVEAKAATDEELEHTRAGLDAVRAAEESGQARLREAERRLAEARLTAPYGGTVTEVHFEPGEYAGPGRPVVVLSGDGDLELEVEVPESIVPRIRKGDEVTVVVPLMDTEMVGRIDSVGRTAAGLGRLFPVVTVISEDGGSQEGGLQEGGVVVGATAELVLSFATDDALAVPVEAVVNPGGRRPALFRIVESGGETRAEKIYVEVDSLLGERVTVHQLRTDGDRALAVGDLVVVGGQRGLLDGETVIVDREDGR